MKPWSTATSSISSARAVSPASRTPPPYRGRFGRQLVGHTDRGPGQGVLPGSALGAGGRRFESGGHGLYGSIGSDGSHRSAGAEDEGCGPGHAHVFTNGSTGGEIRVHTVPFSAIGGRNPWPVPDVKLRTYSARSRKSQRRKPQAPKKNGKGSGEGLTCGRSNMLVGSATASYMHYI